MLFAMPGYGARYWAERTPVSRRATYPAFRGPATADAVVIGGGLTGCMATSVLAAAGFDVIQLEANRLAQGSTAGGLGIIAPQPNVGFRELEGVVGRRIARIAFKESRRSALELASAIRRHDIRCDLIPVALGINARNKEEAEALRRERDARRDADLEAAHLSETAARGLVRTDTAGALRLPDTFLFDPVRAALGFAEVAARRGARIFEQSPVKRTRFTRKTADVVLGSGTIRTRAIVVATGEPGTLFGQLRRHVRRDDGFVVVTDTLPAPARREIGPIEAVITEGGREPWVRPLPEHRLMFAGASAKPAGPRAISKAVVQRTAQLMYELSVRYPPISGLPARWGWTVPIVTTPDGLPWIGAHRNYPFHFFAMAFGWQGDALGWGAARAAVRFLNGETRKEDEALGFVRHL